MANLLGPSAFGAADSTLMRPVVTPDNSGADAWFKDCSSPINDDGTEIVAAWLNAITAQLRHAVRLGQITEDNADDMLARALRSQRGNFVSASGVAGSANAITLAFSPTFGSLADLVGVPLRFLAEATNTSAVTVSVDGLAATAVQRPDGSALRPGDISSGQLIQCVFDGTSFKMSVDTIFDPKTPYFIATGSAPFSIPNSVDTKVNNISSLDSSFFNAGSSFASSAFTCGAKDAGAWLFIGSAAMVMAIASAGGTAYRLSISRNAVTGPFTSTYLAGAGTFSQTNVTPFTIAAGDVVDMRAFQDTGTNRNVEATLLFGVRLGDS
jgi:hypothetical protein